MVDIIRERIDARALAGDTAVNKDAGSQEMR